MDVHSPLFRLIARALVGVLFLNPLLSTAAELSVDAAAGGNTQITAAANGVPIVNIATPNAGGLSHNKFTDYNVGQQGLILNNGTAAFNETQLGGVILGNSNLRGGAAKLILNEVTGSNQSQLKGYTEVAGQGAHVVVANPHGITCDGCGFINTPRATLTTGTPVIANGRLDHYDVNGGAIAIEGAGLNASNISQFELITRSAKLNAELQAQRLAIIAGRNRVDASSMAATAKADDGSSKPLLAIDSSALGGMYAGAIRLVGTEAGVGVKLSGDMAASADDIDIDVNGKLTIARAASAANLRATAKQIELTERVYAGKNVNLTAEQIDIASSLASGNDLRLSSARINNQGRLEAGVRGDGSGNSAAVLDVRGGTLNNHGSVTSQGRLDIDLQQLNNQGQKVLAVGAATIKAVTLNNAGGQLVAQQTLSVTARNLDNRAGTVASNQALSLTLAGTLNNSADGLLLSKAGGLTLNLDTLLNQGGTVLAEGGALTVVSSTTDNRSGNLQGASVGLTASSTLINDGGRIAATQGQHMLTAGSVSNKGGSLLAATKLKVIAASLNNQGGSLGAQHIDLDLSGDLNNDAGLVEAGDDLQLHAHGLSNNGGKLRALGSTGHSQFMLGGLFNNDGGLVEIGNSRLTLSSAALSNQNGTVRHLGSESFALSLADAGQAGGRFITNGELNLDVADWTNTSLLQAQKISLKVGTFTQSASGQLLSVDSINASGDSWHNDGRIETGGDLNLTLTGDYSGNGVLQSAGNLNIAAANASTGSNALWKAGGAARFSIGGNLVNRGQLTAAQNLIVRANSLSNYGTLGAATTLRIEARDLLNDSGLLFSGSDMALRVERFINRLATVYSLGTLSIAGNDQGDAASLVENRSGTLESGGDMSIHATTINNLRDVLSTVQSKYSARITELPCSSDYGAGDCSGKRNGIWEIVERDRLSVGPESTAASFLTAGGKLDLRGTTLSNQSSAISAGSDLNVQVKDLQNTGIQTGEVETYRIFRSERTRNIDSWQQEAEQFTAAYWNQPNVDGNSLIAALNHFIGRTEEENTAFRRITSLPSGDQRYAGIIQAGGNVTISAQAGFDSSVVRPTFAYVAGGYLTDTRAGGSTLATAVSLNPQLPADTTQQPVSLPTFSLPQGQNGLFHVNTDPSHPYLVETNPAFASLRGFLSSDYLLNIIGYNQDLTQRRLGDGLYEQRLVQQAIVARTGKRFLDGLSSDEAQFRYLMDNAIASKQALNLVPGIALSAAQVAALTHDIVWMQEQQVDGQKVLVPVLYLAQARDRLSPTGALIQSQDVTLISGSSLKNSGTLRASNNLNASANSISNNGLMQANERLSLLATDSIRNAQGGLIAGKNVSAIALTGDIVNQRSVTTHESAKQGFERREDFVDNAAGIEASNNLTLSAGRDLINQGGNLKAGGNAKLSAGRDLLIVSQSETDVANNRDRKGYSNRSQTNQYGASVLVGGSIDADAGRDLTVMASGIKAGGDVDLTAARDVSLLAAANTYDSEYRHKGGSKKVQRESSSVLNQASEVEAGGSVKVYAGQDLAIAGSKVKALDNVALDAERDIKVVSVQNESAAYNSVSKKGTFGRSSSKQSERYESTNVASRIQAGKDLSINTSKAADGTLSIDGGRDVAVVGSQLRAGNDLTVGATRDVAIVSGADEQGSYNKKTKSSFLGVSKSGSSQLKTSSSQVASELDASHDVVIAAGNDARLRASNVSAGNDAELRAGLVTKTGDITLASANDAAYSEAERYNKKAGFSFSGGMLSLGSAKNAEQQTQSSTAVGSQVTAQRDAILQAQRDINVIGSSTSAGRNLVLDAGQDINVLSAQNQSAATRSERKRLSGIGVSADSNGFTAFVGNDVQTDKRLTTQTTAAASQLQAGIDLSLNAGRDINQTGSDLIAGRDISMKATRSISVDAASEGLSKEHEEAHQRNGLTGTMNHNFANTVDAIKGVGQGENIVSQVSSVLKAADSVTQFVSGPTTDTHLGTTGQQTDTLQGVVSNRASTLMAGRDVNLQAADDIAVRGSHIQTVRDINIAARDITLDVARGQTTTQTEQTLRQSGLNGGSTFNSSRAGVGASHGTITEDGRSGTALPTRLEAGRNVNLNADRDLGLIGTQVLARDDINLKTGNDLTIRAAQNDVDYDMRRKSGGGEVGLALGGQDFISVYASVDVGRGKLDRENARQQEAYLYAGKGLNFDSGRDTTVAGARLDGETVTGKVGRDLLVSSLPDTGKVNGKELDASMTVSVGIYGSVGVSGSVGVGKTNGSTEWVQNQTAITARDRLDIRTENHTQLDGAVLASGTGNLKLDTDTLGFRDIKGHDREHAWYINAGGSYSSGGDSAPNAAATTAVVDSSQQNKDGSNSWNLSGYDDRSEREQHLRATVGQGEIVVRNDASTGSDSTAELNRDLSKSYEITQDEKERTDLYVSSSSLGAVSRPVETLGSWKVGMESYGRNAVQAFVNMDLLKDAAITAADNNRLVAALAWTPALLVDAIDSMNLPTLGVFPGPGNYGGLFTQLPVLVTGDLRPVRVVAKYKMDGDKVVLENGKPVIESKTVERFNGFNKDETIFTNGIMNSMMEALSNGLMQTGNGTGNTDFVLAYNPTHGLIGDLVESAFDKNGGTVLSGTARNLNDLFQGAVDAGPDSLRIYGHSQGGLLTWVAIKGMDFSNVQMTTIQLSGAPVDAIEFHKDAKEADLGEKVFQVNRPDDSVFFGLLPKTDSVADLPVFLGGNSQYSNDPVKRALGAIFTITSLFSAGSPHSNYSCITCPPERPESINSQIRNIVIKPTLIDKHGNAMRVP